MQKPRALSPTPLRPPMAKCYPFMLPPLAGQGGAWAGAEGAARPPQTFLRPGSDAVTRGEGRRRKDGKEGERKKEKRSRRRKGHSRRKEWERRKKRGREEEEETLG